MVATPRFEALLVAEKGVFVDRMLRLDKSLLRLLERFGSLLKGYIGSNCVNPG
jgi:hypothetical protein